MQNKHMITATIEYAHYVGIGQVATIEIVWDNGFRDRFKAANSETYYTEYREFLSDSEHEQILKLIEQAKKVVIVGMNLRKQLLKKRGFEGFLSKLVGRIEIQF